MGAEHKRTGKKCDMLYNENGISSLDKVLASSHEKVGKLGSVSVLPDYFVDRFVKIRSIDDLFTAIQKKGFEGGGGSLRGVAQTEVKGGNAVNMGYALATLGAKVNLFTIAEGLTAEALRSTFSKLENVKLEIIEGKCGFTTVFEFEQKGRIVNVMVSDVGDLHDFDGSTISDWRSLSESKIVSVLNWASNISGTKLCERVFRAAKDKRRMTFFDPADLSEHAHLIGDLKKEVMSQGLVDVISMNDNEARIMCKSLCGVTLAQDYDDDELKDIAVKLQEATGARVDLHTRKLSLSCSGGRETIDSMPCHKVKQLIVTGAGDVWDSADLIGYLCGWSSTDRLAFANAAAGLYVSKDSAIPPTFDQVIQFMTSRT